MISRTLSTTGGTLHYADFGGDGPTVVLVHGLGGSHANWLAVAPDLALRGRVYALDLPGFGRSALDPRGTSLEIMGEGLSRFIDAVSTEPVHLIGNSMGGTLTILEGYARPQRIASTLLVGPALPPPPGARVDPAWMRTLLVACAPFGHVLLRRRAANLGPEKGVRELVALCCDPENVPREVLEAHVAMAAERTSTPWVERAFAQATRSLMAQVLFGRKLRRALRQSGPPTLIVHGRSDRLVDVRASRAVVAANPGIELIELPDLGHCPQLDAPKLFVDIANRWLDRVAATPADRAGGEERRA